MKTKSVCQNDWKGVFSTLRSKCVFHTTIVRLKFPYAHTSFVNSSLVTPEHLKHPVPETGRVSVESLTPVGAEDTQAHCGCLLVLQMDNLRLREG